MDLDLLARLCSAPGPPGDEEAVLAIVRDELEATSEISRDPLGGMVARRPADGPRLLLAAHADEIAFIVSHVEPGGFLRVLPLGGFDPKTLTAQRVIVHGRDGDLLGVMGAKPVHLMSDDEKRRAPAVEDFYVDVGLPEDRVRERIRVGDRVTRERGLARMGDLVTAKSLDNRAGLFVMIEAMKRLGPCVCDIHAAATTQEEVGARGARVVASRVTPALGLAIDVTLANEGPDAQAHQRVTRVGEGAAIKVFDRSAIVPAAVVDHLVALAEARGIPHQLEVMPRGGTDTRELQLAGEGALAGAVSIPTRYVHQVVEACHPDDLEACIALVTAFCETAEELLGDG